MATMIEPFTLSVPDAELEGLRARLRATRWPEPATDPRQGVPLECLRERCARWAQDYDWRATERCLNAVPQFTAVIDGLPIHFLHARSPRPEAFPLVLTHGWPGSVVEYLDVLPLLTEMGFHCVVPSLPGYGFSGKPTEPGWGVVRIADAWAALMARLGYARYGAQGSDWGTSISAGLGQQDPAHVAGIHLMPPLAPTTDAGRQTDDDAGYSTQQRTRPQTVGYALTDSPSGLAAWIGEKLDAWADPRTPIPEQRILDTLMLYWLPRTAASSARLYWESLGDVTRWLEGPVEPRDRVDAPTGGTIFPHELQRPTRDQAAARFTDIRYWSEPERGGHFPALEQPETFAAEVAAFFALVR
jgi:pimeloyl-ACP methyl ester carboxylesterase